MAIINDNLTVSSDFDLLSSKINLIKSKANTVIASLDNTASLANNASSLGSTTNVPKQEFPIINKNNESIKILINKINTEMDAILHIGENIKNMEFSLSNEANLLNCEIHDSACDTNSIYCNNGPHDATITDMTMISNDSKNMIIWYEGAKGRGVINDD